MLPSCSRTQCCSFFFRELVPKKSAARTHTVLERRGAASGEIMINPQMKRRVLPHSRKWPTMNNSSSSWLQCGRSAGEASGLNEPLPQDFDGHRRQTARLQAVWSQVSYSTLLDYSKPKIETVPFAEQKDRKLRIYCRIGLITCGITPRNLPAVCNAGERLSDICYSLLKKFYNT